MSTIFLPIGQCGNQLAKCLYEYIDANETQQTSYLYKTFDGKYRSINVDSEVKVIYGLLNQFKAKLRRENFISSKCGRGNNWASGYMGLANDGSLGLIEKTVEIIRREAEQCDFLSSFYMLHSLSGGTGSGLGSRLMEKLRDEYGHKKYLFNCTVAPFRDGDTPLQYYNNLLCMSHLHEYSDMIHLFQNDDLLNTITKHNNSSTDTTSLTLNQMNSYLVKCLFSTCLYPVDSVSMKKQSIGFEMLEMQRLIASNKQLKIIELFTLSEKTKSSFQTKPLRDLLSFVKKSDYKPTTLNSLIVLRGELSNELYKFQNAEDDVKKLLKCVQWNPFTVDYWCSKRTVVQPQVAIARQSSFTKTTDNNLSSLSIALNRNYCVKYLNEIKQKSSIKYKHRAYLHWYEKYGVGEDFFLNSFENLNQIIDSYTQMTAP